MVKAFNIIYFGHILSLGRTVGAPDHSAVSITGDDAAAKESVTRSIIDRSTTRSTPALRARVGASRTGALPTSCHIRSIPDFHGRTTLVNRSRRRGSVRSSKPRDAADSDWPQEEIRRIAHLYEALSERDCRLFLEGIRPSIRDRCSFTAEIEVAAIPDRWIVGRSNIAQTGRTSVRTFSKSLGDSEFDRTTRGGAELVGMVDRPISTVRVSA